MKTREEIFEDLSRIRDLPSLPRVVLRLQQEMNKPEVGIDAIARIITEDPPIAMTVLKVVNSPLYRSMRKIVSIRDAAVRLGLKEIYEIVLTTSMCNLMKSSHGIDFTRFWNHSISVAHASKAIISISSKRRGTFDKSVTDAAFTAALLHDIGVLVLEKYMPGTYGRLVDENDAGNPIPINVFEQRNFGVTHAETGAFLLRRWHLPEVIALGVEKHHSPLATEKSHHIAEIIHVADYTCTNEGISGGVEGWTNEYIDSAWKSLGASLDDIPEIIHAVREQLKKSPLLVV